MSETNYTEEFPEGIFPISFKLIYQYQPKESILMAKDEMGTYHKGSFCGEINVNIRLITCEDNNFIP